MKKFLRRYVFLPIVISVDMLLSRFYMRNRGCIARFGPFHVLSDNKVVLNGALDNRVFSQVAALFDKYPDISVMKFERCPGSLDDEEMIRAGLLIHEKRCHVHVPGNGKICSGGVDLFFSGTKRTIDKGARLGVHAWDDDTGSNAQNTPDNSSEHQMYIDYYASIGWSKNDAKKLYRFIINSAPPNKTYYLTESDIAVYKILNS